MINFNQYRQEIERNCNVFYDYILTLTRCKCCTRLNTQENRCAQWLFFGSVYIQRNAQDHESDDPLSDRWDHDLVNPCPEWIPWITDLEINGFAWKECDRSVILIQILPKERALSLYTDVLFFFLFFSKTSASEKEK